MTNKKDPNLSPQQVRALIGKTYYYKSQIDFFCFSFMQLV